MVSDTLLLQFKKDLPEVPVERAAVAAVGKIDPGRIRAWHAPSAMPGLSLLDGISRLVIGGSGWSVFEAIPHYARAKRLLVEARRRKIPMLGICFGAQMIADAFGGKVVRDNANEEFGTFDLALSEAAAQDPLMSATPVAFAAQCAHQDRIETLPADAVILASSERCPVHAFRLGQDRIYGLQFHPERTFEDSAGLAARCKDGFLASRREAFERSLRPSTEASDILRRFLLL